MFPGRLRRLNIWHFKEHLDSVLRAAWTEATARVYYLHNFRDSSYTKYEVL